MHDMRCEKCRGKLKCEICEEMKGDYRFTEYIRVSSADRNKMYCEALKKIDILQVVANVYPLHRWKIG